jgi:hypothetical protein
MHPNWEGEIGTAGEAPSFLYAMPLDDGTVFLEETCLVARPTLPFSALKRRLERRCAAMGIEIEEVQAPACLRMCPKLCEISLFPIFWYYFDHFWSIICRFWMRSIPTSRWAAPCR